MTAVNAAILGAGTMGRVHARAFALANNAGDDCRVVAFCDRDAAALERLRRTERETIEAFGADGAELTTDLDAVLADPEIGLAVVCTPTDTHVELAGRALRAGKHVLVEKPVSLRRGEIESLAEVARASGRLCMPAMCVRFWPAWALVAEATRDHRFGRMLAASFARLGPAPDWSGFYADHARSGGALVDLHVHDTDFVCSALGGPEAVFTRGTGTRVSTEYIYAGEAAPTPVTAAASWDMDPGFGFRMAFTVAFEGASTDFELGRDPEFRVHVGGEELTPALDDITGYDGQLRALLAAIRAGADEAPATLAEAARVMGVIDAERRSLESGRVEAVGG